MIKKVYSRSRRLASRVKRRLLNQQPKAGLITPYIKPAIRSQSLEQHGGPFRAAIIGAGNQGRDIALGLVQLEGVQVVAVADRYEESIAQFQSKVTLPNAHFYRDAKELLAAESVDLICVATNTPSHVPLALMALNTSAKYLLVEKPIGTNPQRARELAQACAQREKVLAINHSRRWSLDYIAMKHYIASGRIGSVRQIYVSPGSGGLAMNGVHFIDLMRFFTGCDISWAVGHLDPVTVPNKRGADYHDPSGYGVLHFQDGARGFLDFSQDLLRKEGFLVIKTANGRIEVDERAGHWTIVSQEGRTTIPFADSKTLPGKVARVVGDLLSCEPPRSSGEDGVAALEAVIALHVSHGNNHQPVSLPLSDEHRAIDIPFP
jgi:predicted dehydrogenase